MAQKLRFNVYYRNLSSKYHDLPFNDAIHKFCIYNAFLLISYRAEIQ